MIEKLIEQIKNDSYAPISFDLGFTIRKLILSLPESHKVWDDIALNLANDLSVFKIKDILKAMPLLSADEENLPQEYLLRASTLITGFAHAFYYPDGYSPDVQLPNSVLIPMEQIAVRIGKKLSQDKENPEEALYVGRTYLEDFLANWNYKVNNDNLDTVSLDTIQINNLKLMLPYFCNQEEYVSTVITGAVMQARFAPVVHIISEMEKELELSNPSPQHLIMFINNAKKILEEVKTAFMQMSPKLGNKYFVDQVIWPLTSPTMGKKVHPNEYPNTGADSPIFHVMDKLLNRTSYDSKMGKNITQRFKAVPSNYQQFIMAVEPVGAELFNFIKNAGNPDLKNAYANLVSFYAGPNGFLDSHRKKAYGYLKMSFLAGRLSTNGKEQGNANTRVCQDTGLTPWGRLNTSFLQGMEERLEVLKRLNIDTPDLIIKQMSDFISRQVNPKTFTPHQVAGMCVKGQSVASYRGRLFSLDKIIKSHPGGHRVIQSLEGGDMTLELEQAHVLNLPMIQSLLKKHYLGEIEKPNLVEAFRSPIENWTDIVFLMTAVQNNIKNIWYFDKSEVNDRSRFMPFQFVMKTIHIIFGPDGYFDSLLDRVDKNLVIKYREKTMSVFTQLQAEAQQGIKFCDIGQYVMQLGLAEIKTKKLSTIEETEVNRLETGKLYNYLVIEGIQFLNQLKEKIIIKIDDCIQNEEQNAVEIADHFNKELVNFVDVSMDNFILQIDRPEILALSQLTNRALSTAFVLPHYPKINRRVCSAIMMSLALASYVSLKSDKDDLTIFGSALLIVCIAIFAISRVQFFNQLEKEQQPEHTRNFSL